jgi:hypothetical protein
MLVDVLPPVVGVRQHHHLHHHFCTRYGLPASQHLIRQAQPINLGRAGRMPIVNMPGTTWMNYSRTMPSSARVALLKFDHVLHCYEGPPARNDDCI